MRLKVSPKFFAAVGVAVFTLYVIVANWGGNPLSLKNVATVLVVGVSLGGVYAILAGGLVVTYATVGAAWNIWSRTQLMFGIQIRWLAIGVVIAFVALGVIVHFMRKGKTSPPTAQG